MRSMWSGYVSFGLVTIPVKLYAATEDVRTPLHEVHTCGSRIRHRRVCEREDREVTQEEIRRGWQAPDGEVVVLGAGDLEHLPLPTLKTAEVLGFVDDGDVDPLMYDRPYWAGPAGDAAQRPYALLVEALARHGTVAVCKVALRTRERLAVLRPRHGMLVLHTLRWPEEIRDPGDLTSSAPVTDRELQLAEVLMDALAGVDIGDLRDEYAVALEQLIVAKVSGRELEADAEPEPAVDLVAALERSIRDARGR
ncbi:non-homologous end joining protein Ku [Actinacidiphila oryziradicis]|uniref:Non-homologous end joining protein Ku n=1 Tax=Actinacidiphila oryziradicis TaxID=2571141 RepID=A0A4U0RV46_9ACTN|nr:Ku protein [Actinacidiphila oryziradicis]TKA00112.1 Ku protein [Actinacidiphila oryziradicis]